MRATRLFLALLSILLFTTAAHAQWISFTDETSSRLHLNAFTDNPGGNPINDDQEKDIAVGDLNGDGKLDAVVVRKQPFSNAGARQDFLLINSRGGNLRDYTALYAPEFLTKLTDARDVIIRDFTGDGWPDVVICNTFGEQPCFYRNRGAALLGSRFTRNSWRGLVDESASRFPTIQVPQDVSTRQFCAVWAGDVNGDNALDLYFSNYDPNAATNDILFINDGSGNFTNETDTRLGNLANVSFGTSVEIHDVDNDGDNDIVKTSTLYSAAPFPTGIFVLYNDGTGNFSTFQDLGSPDPYMFTVGDLDGNGWLDIYIVEDSQDRVALAQGVDGNGQVIYNTSTIQNSERTEDFGGNIKFKDLDGDGDLDLGVAPIDVDIQNCLPDYGSSGNSGFCLLRNDGSGGLTDPYDGTTQNFNLSVHDYDYIDINEDGKMDLILGLCTGWRILIQD